MGADTTRVSVSLRRADGRTRYLLSNYEVVGAGDLFEPIEFEGVRYSFSHKTTAGGYEQGAQDVLYVFVATGDPPPRFSVGSR